LKRSLGKPQSAGEPRELARLQYHWFHNRGTRLTIAPCQPHTSNNNKPRCCFRKTANILLRLLPRLGKREENRSGHRTVLRYRASWILATSLSDCGEIGCAIQGSGETRVHFWGMPTICLTRANAMLVWEAPHQGALRGSATSSGSLRAALALNRP
jgi:hypothetical protein